MSNSVKQVLVVRKDLSMRAGKIAAQCCHASTKVLLDLNESSEENYLKIKLDKYFKEWLATGTAKVCVYVNSKKELHSAYEKAKLLYLPCALITDAGRTEFHGQPTDTCVAIGPAPASLIDTITGDLKLL